MFTLVILNMVGGPKVSVHDTFDDAMANAPYRNTDGIKYVVINNELHACALHNITEIVY